MATCKDCLHIEVCPFKRYRVEKDRMEKRCSFFKDRARFVELPYKLGDVVFIIFERQVVGCVVSRISFTKYGGANITLDSLDDNDYGTIYGLLADDDCEIFLTRKEAEQVLKERGS